MLRAMSFNARGDVFAAGSAEGQPIEMMRLIDVAKLPSGDAPGKNVAAILNAKRLSRSHPMHVAELRAGKPVTPITVRDGVLVDGHHRVAAAIDAGHYRIPVRHATGR